MENLNVVEIGRPYFKYVLPKTRLFASLSAGASGEYPSEPLSNLRGALQNPDLDLIVCHAPVGSPWSMRWWFRSIGNRKFLRGYLPLTSMLAPHFLRLQTRAPIAVIDLEDNPFIGRGDLFLMDRAKLYFKRELPIDRWQVFMCTDHDSVPSKRYRLLSRNSRRVSKLRPISLGHLHFSGVRFPEKAPVKTSDIFFAGLVQGSSTVRTSGIDQLQAMSKDGWRIDLAQTRLSRSEFLERASSAYLVWSPEGFGWDCFRHYEASLCWSVPLINHPTIVRHQPLLDGEHALYYNVEGDGLTRAATAALQNRSNLIQIAAKGREHVLQHHMIPEIVRYVAESTLG
jgi:hypothetical protein